MPDARTDKSLTDDFRAAVGRRNAPVFVDQEGGRVQRLGRPAMPGGNIRPPAPMAKPTESDPLAALRTARNVGRLMADDLIGPASPPIVCRCSTCRSPGHEIIGSRAYSDRIEQIMALARAHDAGFADGGVLPVIKHIPGHGRAKADSHLELPVVTRSAPNSRP